jgi:hypothetical protein
MANVPYLRHNNPNNKVTKNSKNLILLHCARRTVEDNFQKISHIDQ